MPRLRIVSRIRLFFAAALLVIPTLAKAEERTVNFYNWSSYMAPGVLEDFTRETGIKVVYDTFDANETLETRLLAGKSGYDVVVPTAYFLQRQIKANVFQKLDKSKLPNLANAWSLVTARLAIYDPDNQYAANYMWGTTGIGYNVTKIESILGPGVAIDSWDIVFKPESLARFKDCGVHMLDSPDDIFPAALSYLGLDPNSTKQADLDKAADLVSKIRPFVRKFHSSEYLNALATGEICLVVGWSGDIMQARSRAAEAKNGIAIGYAIPKEGGQMFFDNLSIPADARNVKEAYELINFLYRPDIAARNSNFLSYANGNLREPEAARSENPQRQEYLSGRCDARQALRHHGARSGDPTHHQSALDQGEDRALASGSFTANGGAAIATDPGIRESIPRLPR